MTILDASSDPVKELVLRFLLSYGGIAGGVSFLTEGLKMMFKSFFEGRENVFVILFSFGLGAAAKALMPGVYGPSTAGSWGLHLLILVFVAVGAAAFHDKFLSVLTSFITKKPPSTGGGGCADEQSGGRQGGSITGADGPDGGVSK
jgi:hypothetical protein